MKVRQHTLCLLSFLLFCAGCGSRSIEGVVTDDKGRPIDGAKIILLNEQGSGIEGKQDWLSRTDSQGRYSIAAPRRAAVSIAVSLNSYESEIRKLSADAPNPVNFVLQPIRTFSVGDRVRVLDIGWCPGTITGVGLGQDKDQYKVDLDRQPRAMVEVTTPRSRIRPLESARPRVPLPCSFFRKSPPS
jgi:carboxypeptidase family protein